MQYEQYLLHEVLPLSWQKNQTPFLITTGASFGAYHAVNFALRHPDLVGRTLGMSGIYEIDLWTDGYSDDNIYFNNPNAYIPNEHDWGRLEALRNMDIILAVGRDDSLRHSSERLSTRLVGQRHWQRASDFGMVGPMIGPIGTTCCWLISAGMTKLIFDKLFFSKLSPAAVQGSATADRRTQISRRKIMTLKVGLMVGREWSFPPAFIEEVNRRDAGVDGRICTPRRHAYE